jgi:DNA helicase-2/ATP-dependent DNA helicase PcrA
VSDEAVHAALRSEARLVVIEAPAGCGKTHQGAEYAKDVAIAGGRGRPLILTHTHAACSVFAERTRGNNLRSRVDIRTIDSLIGQVAEAYHASLGLPGDIAGWVRGRDDGHTQLASRVAAFINRHGMIADAIARRHPVVICDEHQDASGDQHSVVKSIHNKGALLRVFADPMQRIFGDRESGAGYDWDTFTGAANTFTALNTPHRWGQSCPDLGQWTLEVRRRLRDGGLVDLRDGRRPQSVQVVIAENRAQRNLAYQLSAQDRRAIDAFELHHQGLLILTRYNETAAALRSFFNRRVPLWEGYTRYALDRLVNAVVAARGSGERLGAAIVAFMGEVGIGLSTNAA